MLESIIHSSLLGAIQGIVEWLPVSSEGVITLIEVHVLGQADLGGIVRFALFLHLGTFLAALVYFRQDVGRLMAALWHYQAARKEDQVLLRFLGSATLISGVLGFGLLQLLERLEYMGDLTADTTRTFTVLVGLLLIVTAGVQLFRQQRTLRKHTARPLRTIGDLNALDSLILGLAQGLAALPGLSRSGLTVSALLLRHIEEQAALRVSFLMSLPLVLAGNIVLNILDDGIELTVGHVMGFLAAFVFGLLTIHGLLVLARRMNFGVIVLVFGIGVLVTAGLTGY